MFSSMKYDKINVNMFAIEIVRFSMKMEIPLRIIVALLTFDRCQKIVSIDAQFYIGKLLKVVGVSVEACCFHT